MDEYLVPTDFGEDEFTEKKSRFIGRVWPVETEEEALEKIQQMKKQHYDATHNCWAYIIKDGAVRFSDDGEPGGTAGMPMLQVLQREGLFNIVCVVTRYFGGILLGAGGLVRAYTKGAKIAVDAAEVARHHAHAVKKPLPLQHLQHGHTGRAARLAVVGKTYGAVADDIGPAVVGGVVVLLLHFLNALQRLFLRLHRPHPANKTGFFLHKFVFAELCGYQILIHEAYISPITYSRRRP